MPTAIFADSYVFVTVQLILTTSKNKSFASHVLLGTDMISQKHRVFLSAIIISKQVDKIFTSDRLFLKFYYNISDGQNLYFWKRKEPLP